MLNFQLIMSNAQQISVNLDPDQTECFTQKKISDIVDEVASSQFPGYLMGGIVRDNDGGLSLYDGVKLVQYRWIDKEKDPSTKDKVRSVHFFMHLDQLTFQELKPQELEEIDVFAAALEKENPHLSSETRRQAITVLATHYLKIYNETQDGEWLKKAKIWIDFGKEQGMLGEVIGAMYAQCLGKTAMAPKESPKQCQEEVIAILKGSNAPMTPRQIIDQMLPGHGKHLNGALQYLVHNKQLDEFKTTTGRTYQIHIREPFDEAVQKINPQNENERFTITHPTWLEGAKFGKPRKGHPEGQIVYHILEVLENVKVMHKNDPELRLLAILHDTFKHQVDYSHSKHGENHHGKYARTFAEQFIQDKEFLDILQRHDDAYNIYNMAKNDGDWEQAEAKAKELIHSFPTKHRLYLNFYECDCKTGTKTHAPFDWFLKVYHSLTLTE